MFFYEYIFRNKGEAEIIDREWDMVVGRTFARTADIFI